MESRPLGRVLAVVLIGAGVITMLATGGEPSDELIREYFSRRPVEGPASRPSASR